MTAALTGTTSDLNTTMSKRKDTAITAPIRSGNLSPERVVKSTPAAVNPPISTSSPVSTSACGMTSLLRRRTSASVASSWGEVVGYTVTIAAVGSTGSLGIGGGTKATPGVDSTAPATAWNA